MLEAIGNQSCSDSVLVCALSNEVTVNIGLSRVKKGKFAQGKTCFFESRGVNVQNDQQLLFLFSDSLNKDLCEQAMINLETTIIECCLIEQSNALEVRVQLKRLQSI